MKIEFLKKINYYGVVDTRKYRYMVHKNWWTGKATVYRKKIEELDRTPVDFTNGWNFVCEYHF